MPFDFLILSTHLRIGLPKGLFLVKILKALLPSSILAAWPTHSNPVELITLTILGEWYKLRSPSGRIRAQNFYVLKKIHDLSGFEPATLGSRGGRHISKHKYLNNDYLTIIAEILKHLK